MEQPGLKTALIAEFGASSAQLELVVTHVPLERMIKPGACSSWSVKDVLAHLAVENDWLSLQLGQWARGEDSGSKELQHNQELGLAVQETHNAYYAHLRRDLDLAYVRDWSRRANERLLVALAELPEARRSRSPIGGRTAERWKPLRP